MASSSSSAEITLWKRGHAETRGVLTVPAVTVGSPACTSEEVWEMALKWGFSSRISWETQECRREELLGVRKATGSLVNASPAKRASLHGANHLQAVCLDVWL